MSTDSPELGSGEMAVPDDVKVVHFGSNLARNRLIDDRKLTEPWPDEEPDPVRHPSHYTGHPTGIEALEVIEWNPYPNLANVLKYVWRVSWGGKSDDLEDLRKAAFYLEREIQRRQSALYTG